MPCWRLRAQKDRRPWKPAWIVVCTGANMLLLGPRTHFPNCLQVNNWNPIKSLVLHMILLTQLCNRFAHVTTAEMSWQVQTCDLIPLLYPPLNEVEGEYTVRPSVDRIVSTLYLLQYLPDPFHIYTSYQATSEGVSRVEFFFQNSKSFDKFLKFVTLTLSCFDLRSNMNGSIVWVIMGQRGVSSERRRSSCFSHEGNLQFVRFGFMSYKYLVKWAPDSIRVYSL